MSSQYCSTFSHGQRYVEGSGQRSFAAGDLSHSASTTGYKTQYLKDTIENKRTTRTTTTKRQQQEQERRTGATRSYQHRSYQHQQQQATSNKQQQCGQEIHLATPNGPKMMQTLGPLPVVATGSLKTTLAMSPLGQQPKAQAQAQGIQTFVKV